MSKRIERQSAKSRSGRITEPVRHPTVGDFMKHDCDQNGKRPNCDLTDCFFQYGPAGELLPYAYGKAEEKTSWKNAVYNSCVGADPPCLPSETGDSVGAPLSLRHSINPFLCAPSLSRMMFAVYFFKTRAVDVSIDLRRRNIGVAQHRLY